MKILHKLMLGYLAAGLLIAISGFLSARVAERSLERRIADLSSDVAAQLLDRVILEVQGRVELFRAYARTDLMRRTLEESNRRYEAMPDREAYIDAVDVEWKAAVEASVPDGPEVFRELQEEPLSREFEGMVKFFTSSRVAEVFVANRYGANAALSGLTSDFRQNDEDWWLAAFADGLYLGPVGLDKSTETNSVEVAVRVDDQQGRPIGVLKVVLNVEALRTALEEAFEKDIAEERRPAFWCLLDTRTEAEDEVVVADEETERRPDLRAELPQTLPAGVLEGRPGSAKGTFAATTGAGERLICAYASSLPRQAPGVPQWIVVAAYNRAVLHAPITHVTLQIGGVSVVVIVLGITLGWLMSRSICLRIDRLRRGTEEIGGGNLAHSVAMADTDEIGELSRAFDTMSVNLQQTMASRDELNAEVERREQVEERLRETLADLSRSNEELQQFAYVASHDLQEPLRKIRAFGDRLATISADCLSEKGADYLDRMQNAARRMSELIEDLLTLSRVATRGRPFEPVDMNQVVRDVLGDLELRIQETGAEVTADDLPTIDADPVQMRELLQNLTSNALKFQKEGEAPVIHLTGEKGAGPGGEEVFRLTVADNGIGFDEKFAERIFGVFQRLHGRGEYPGTGIGLAVCRKIAERHGGTIAASGTPGEGATFTVMLPVEQHEEEEEPCSSDPSQS